jgi:hypothetical protein
MNPLPSIWVKVAAVEARLVSSRRSLRVADRGLSTGARDERIAATPRGDSMKPWMALTAAAVAVALAGGPAWATQSEIRVAPREIDFGTRMVGTENYDGVRVTNTSGRTLQVLVEAGLPDDFGFGLMPRSTCPVFAPGALMASGDSCRAVVRFSPTEFFAGSVQTGTLTVSATDLATGAVTRLEIPVSGVGRL